MDTEALEDQFFNLPGDVTLPHAPFLLINFDQIIEKIRQHPRKRRHGPGGAKSSGRRTRNQGTDHHTVRVHNSGSVSR